MKKILGAVVFTISLVAASALAAEQGNGGNGLTKEQEAVRKATEEVQKELEKNKEVLDMIIKEVLAEARKNKGALKEIFRELGRDKEELQKTIRELANDPELRKNLNELGDILKESTKELSPKGGAEGK